VSVDTAPRTRSARSLFAGIAQEYDRMGALLSLGQDGRWRRFMVSRVARGTAPGELRVLDVATGTGLVARELVGLRPDARVIGLDQSEAMVRRGRSSDERIRFVLGQAERLPFASATIDAVTFTYLLRYVADPAETLAELTRVLGSGGVLANLEFHVPARPWLGPWWFYTRAMLPWLGMLASPRWYETGRFLGPSISSFYDRFPLADQLAMWRAAGIANVRARPMSLGGGVVIWGRKDDGRRA